SNEWPRSARTLLVNSAGDQFFPGAGFPENADASIGNGDAIELRHDVLHGLACPDDFMFSQTLPELRVFRFQPLELQNIFNGEQKFVGGYRLLKKIQRA